MCAPRSPKICSPKTSLKTGEKIPSTASTSQPVTVTVTKMGSRMAHPLMKVLVAQPVEATVASTARKEGELRRGEPPSSPSVPSSRSTAAGTEDTKDPAPR